MIRLIRDIRTPTYTLGRIEQSGRSTVYTLERPWVSVGPVNLAPKKGDLFGEWDSPPCGRKGISCVPPGIYTLVRHESEMHPGSLALVNRELWVYHQDHDVPDSRRGYARTYVLIHPANRVGELRGCIAPGLARDARDGTVWSSRMALAYLNPFPGDTLEIVNE